MKYFVKYYKEDKGRLYNPPTNEYTLKTDMRSEWGANEVAKLNIPNDCVYYEVVENTKTHKTVARQLVQNIGMK